MYQLLGGTRTRVETGVSIGIQSSPDKLVEVVDGYLSEGYRRIKIKIKPGKDWEYIKALRSTFGDITLMVDANSAYTLDDIDFFKRVNDTWGHDVGDEVIKAIAAQLQQGARQSDVVCRNGGEAFLLILPAPARAPPLAIASRVRMPLR